ncbi:MAG: hypothetical protein JRJ12_08040 [Deltaproteobacteria bacterium]|nr:hypothetical protein [Deltaproteobacteria bacterium]MBW2071409.1 hypothetical protein [Deltaproteobacteria bacterium]
MNDFIIHKPPISVMDLVMLRERGSEIKVNTSFEINEVEFIHEKHPFEAFLFFCRFYGTVDAEEYSFRKCYSRGCPHNLCPHVSQAVMIANRYLQRDYVALEKSGIKVTKNLFTLEDMLVKFKDQEDDFVSTLIIDDYINIAKEGNDITIDVSLEYLPAVENFAHNEEKRVFLAANFTVTYLGKKHICHRCLSCYTMKNEKKEQQPALTLANNRLASIYAAFDEANIKYEKEFFTKGA